MFYFSCLFLRVLEAAGGRHRLGVGPRDRGHRGGDQARVRGIQSWARDNAAATTRPCFQATQLLVSCIMSIFAVATPFKHQDLVIGKHMVQMYIYFMTTIFRQIDNQVGFTPVKHSYT